MATATVRMPPPPSSAEGGRRSSRAGGRHKRVRGAAASEPAAKCSSSAVVAAAAPAPVQPLSLAEHVDQLAQGAGAYVARVQALVNAGLVDRRKVLEHYRIIRGFQDAAGGVDVTNGLVPFTEQLLWLVPADGNDGGGLADIRSRGPLGMDELACYLKTSGGCGGQSVECSEAFRQLFFSTEEARATMAQSGVTGVSCLARALTAPGYCRFQEALAVVFFQRGGPSEVEIPHVECRTRLGLPLACRAVVSFRLLPDGRSTLVFLLTVKPQEQPPLSAAAAATVAATGTKAEDTPRRSARRAARRQRREQQREDDDDPASRPRASKRAALSSPSFSSAEAAAARRHNARTPSASAATRATIAWSGDAQVPVSVMQNLKARSPLLAGVSGVSNVAAAGISAVDVAALGAQQEVQLEELCLEERGTVVVAEPSLLRSGSSSEGSEGCTTEADEADAEEGWRLLLAVDECYRSVAAFAFEEGWEEALVEGGGSVAPSPAEAVPAAAAAPVLGLEGGEGASTAVGVAVDDADVWEWADWLWEEGMAGVGAGGEGGGGAGIGALDAGPALVSSPEAWAMLENPSLMHGMDMA